MLLMGREFDTLEELLMLVDIVESELANLSGDYPFESGDEKKLRELVKEANKLLESGHLEGEKVEKLVKELKTIADKYGLV